MCHAVPCQVALDSEKINTVARDEAVVAEADAKAGFGWHHLP